MIHLPWRTTVLAWSLMGGVAAAQATSVPLANVPPGWTVTPEVAVASLWDDNIALDGDVTAGREDLVTTVGSSLAAQYRGRRGHLLLDYRGAYDIHRQYSEFDAADHRGQFEGERRLGRRVTLFARNAFTLTPTTEIPSADATLFVLRRRTTRFNDFRGGVQVTPGPRTSLTMAYGSQWVALAKEELLLPLFRGGLAHRGDVTLRQRLSSRAEVGATYDYQHAEVAQGEEAFDIQHAAVLMDLALSRPLTLGATAGYAWQMAGRGQPARSAPAFGATLTFQGDRATWDLGYGRSYLPSFGFGGTVQNEELRGTLRVPVSRRVAIAAQASARENDALDVSGTLRSVSAQGSALVTLVPWLRLEFFALHVWQDALRPGGRVTRLRAGVRLATLYPMRIR